MADSIFRSETVFHHRLYQHQQVVEFPWIAGRARQQRLGMHGTAEAIDQLQAHALPLRG